MRDSWWSCAIISEGTILRAETDCTNDLVQAQVVSTFLCKLGQGVLLPVLVQMAYHAVYDAIDAVSIGEAAHA